MAQRVTVDLGTQSYPVLVHSGGLEPLGSALAERVASRRAVLVTNPVVGSLHLADALASLRGAGFEVVTLEVPDGEASKTLETWAALVEALLAVGVDRHTPLVSLGGGVTGDIVGFAAATVLRGVPFAQVPTSLLAMVDASVGGKTGVNTRQGKNLVGAFHQPRLVFAATDVLRTLPEEEWRCGMGEAIKHGVIRDAGLVAWLEREAVAIGRRDPTAIAHLVRRCCEIKAEVVSADEREAGLRAILNFGHTAGHAIETALGHGRIRHGEAVALGMLVETRFALARGWCEDGALPARLVGLLASFGLPVALETLDTPESTLRERLGAALRMDKKNVRGRLNLVVPVSLGDVRLASIPAETLRELPDLILSRENEP